MHFPLGARGNNFDSQIKIIYYILGAKGFHLPQVDLSMRDTYNINKAALSRPLGALNL